jgi:hypothetical protein
MSSFFLVDRDWHEWHRAYDAVGSPLALRLEMVQRCIADALTAAPAGPIRVISMCAGEARDLLGALDGHPRAADVRGRLVELDPELAATARSRAPDSIEVLCGDAGASDAYAGAVPADLALVCGVFGNITDADMERTIRALPELCAPGATVIWTRHRRPPDLTPTVRGWFADTGFKEIDFVTPDGFIFGIGVNRFAGAPRPFVPGKQYFDFVGYGALAEACQGCGFIYARGRAENLAWLKSDATTFVAQLQTYDDEAVRRRPEPVVWSPLEYACHVRDVLRIQTERVAQAQREDHPTYTPMGREERVVDDRYNEQDPAVVASELLAAAEAFIALLESLDDAGWARTGVYNYPTPESRDMDWMAAHTDHELYHHRLDITPR